MSQARIRHRYKGRVYLSPVLLDHSSLKWLWLSVFLLLIVVFLVGYISGFEKAEYRWMAKVDSMALVLPEVAVVDPSVLEAQIPAVEEPGASIDVDSVDATAEDNVVAVLEADDPAINEMLTEKINEQSTTDAFETDQLAVENSGASFSIVDNASVNAASHSIQVGMYKSFDNAANKVEQLLTSSLNAYLHEYENKNNETRYNVRFGYFNSFASAGFALKNFEKNYSGSGYVVHINR